eukprot:GEZU01015142.1.p1 GENE.GEZU01015142.1~~GEZU01015142.1.p1  ORF type:complete len:199 (-),score=30.43 GEZU01015142.1:268-864(-)
MSYRRPSNNVNNNSSNYGSNQPLALNSAGSTINIGGSLAQQQQQQSVAGTNQHKYYYTFFAPNRHQQLQSNKHQRLQDQYYQCIHSQPPLITQDTVSMHLQQQHQTAKENRFFVPRPEKDRLRLGNKKIVSVAFIDCGGGGGISRRRGCGGIRSAEDLFVARACSLLWLSLLLWVEGGHLHRWHRGEFGLTCSWLGRY